jgi:tripartite-type tricarboxylate transporter receptor subunit TctC
VLGGTPKEIVAKLNRDFIAAGTSPDVNQKLLDMGGPMNPTSPEELRRFTLSEIEVWRKAADIRIE